MDETDIRRFNRQNDWLPGPCAYCNETGVINDVNFSYQAENQSVKKSLPSISKPLKYTAGSLASIGVLLSLYNRCTEDHKTPKKVTMESSYQNLPEMDLNSTFKPDYSADYSGLEGGKPSVNIPPVPEKINFKGTEYTGSNFINHHPSDEAIIKMLNLLDDSRRNEMPDYPVIEPESFSGGYKSSAPQLKDTRIIDTDKGIKLINEPYLVKDTMRNH
jgi:hypothetical protein